MAQKLIDADAFERAMYEEAFEKDTDMQRWDSGCWIRYKLYERVLDAQPIVDAEPHWIPCSERLPEYFETVITWDGHCYSVEKRIPFIRDEDGNPIKGEWWVSDDYEEETDYYPNLRDGAAIAWMPLPKPYEEEEDDKTNQCGHAC